MFKKLLLTTFLFFSLFGIVYPTKKENTKLFDYCYSLEKILARNTIHKRKNVSEKIKTISEEIVKFGVSKTRGNFVNRMIDQYKTTKNSFIINYVPNRFYCYAWYWTENVNPGVFESVFYTKSKTKINELKSFKNDVDELLNDINLEYKVIQKEFNSLF